LGNVEGASFERTVALVECALQLLVIRDAPCATIRPSSLDCGDPPCALVQCIELLGATSTAAERPPSVTTTSAALDRTVQSAHLAHELYQAARNRRR
jgi:hypothetical protein